VSARTRIEWTDATWNPIRGCTRVSEGCRNCYAERVAARFSGYGQPYAGLAVMTSAGPRWTGSVVAIEEHLDDPMRWRKPRRVFVNSMSDLFHDDVPDDLLDLLFSTMSVCNIHTFQVLTKRPQRMCDYLRAPERAKRIENSSYGLPTGWPIPNVWIGVSGCATISARPNGRSGLKILPTVCRLAGRFRTSGSASASKINRQRTSEFHCYLRPQRRCDSSPSSR